MPKVEATVESLLTVSDLVNKGKLKNLVIKRYKSGINKGKLFVEYSLKDGVNIPGADSAQKRQKVAFLIKDAAVALSEGKEITLLVKKLSADKEEYTHRLEVKN